MRVVICAMAKNEHKYINEWVNHYVKLNVDKIYLYDNDDEDSPFIGDFIDNKSKVEIINLRGVHRDRLQHEVYTNFYNEYKDTFDWCFFCDIDEYLVGVKDIKFWLSMPQYRHANQIRIKWRLFGDDGLIRRDTSKTLMESFKKEVKTTHTRDLVTKNNLERQGKAIVRGGLKNVIIQSPHFASYFRRENVIPSVLPSGKPCWSKVVIKEDYSKEGIFINHYMTKTIEEFVDQKLNRTDAVFGDISLKLDYFWRINEKTQGKLMYLKQRGIDCE